MKRHHLKAIVVLTICIDLLITALRVESLSLQRLAHISPVSGTIAVAQVLFDKFLGRLRWLHPWFVSIPDLNGGWTSSGKVQRPGLAPEEKLGAAIVVQSHFALRLKIDWDVGYTRFLTKAPVTSDAEGGCAGSAFYEFAPKGAGTAYT